MITTFVVDLIYTPDREVKVLETGRGLWAGFTGFGRVYPKSPMWSKHVIPFYQEMGKPVYRKGETKKTVRHGRLAKFPNFDDVADRHRRKSTKPPKKLKHLTFPETDGLVIHPDHLTDEEYLIMRRGYPKIGIVDPYFPLNATFNNKAIMASPPIGTVLEGVMPKQKVYPKMPWEIVAPSILEDFNDSSDGILFFKSPSSSQGWRVDMIARDDLECPERFQTVMDEKRTNGRGHKHKNRTISRAFKYFGSNQRDNMDAYAPNFVVQSGVQAMPIDVAGKTYLPTMRVAMTAWQDEEGYLQMAYHGAYWKLPKHPVDPDDTSKIMISDVKKGRNRRISAKVDQDTFLDVCQQLGESLTPLLVLSMTSTPTEVAMEMLKSEREGDVLSGLRMALDRQCFWSARDEYPKRLGRKILKLAEEDPGINQYLLSLRRNAKNLPQNARRDVLDHLNEDQASDRAKTHLQDLMQNSAYHGARVVRP